MCLASDQLLNKSRACQQCWYKPRPVYVCVILAEESVSDDIYLIPEFTRPTS